MWLLTGVEGPFRLGLSCLRLSFRYALDNIIKIIRYDKNSPGVLVQLRTCEEHPIMEGTPKIYGFGFFRTPDLIGLDLADRIT